MEFRNGDLYSTIGKGVTGLASEKLTIPHTKRFHYGMIVRRLLSGEYEVLESIGSGVTLRRLFMYYTASDIEVYRVNCTDAEAQEAAEQLSEIGGCKYDYLLFGTLILDAVKLMATGHLPPYEAWQLQYTANRRFICTESANYGYTEVGKALVPKGVVSIPSSLRQAEIDNKMTKVYKGNLYDLLPQALAEEYVREGFWSASMLPAPTPH